MKTAYLLGYPLAHSRSPVLHRAAYQALNKPWCYETREVKPEQLQQVMEELKGPDLLGINLTLPLKEVAFQYCRPSEIACQVGAINCLRWNGAEWEGHNTDAQGWLNSFNIETGTCINGRKALVLGAGGACRAILYILRQHNASEIVVFNRSPERALALLHPGERLGGNFEHELQPDCLVIQTTSVGMWPLIHALPQSWPEQLPPGLIACDLIYNPNPTLWLKQASHSGARTLNGCGMLIHQAICAIQWWTGHTPPSEPMWTALQASMENK